MIYAIFLPCLIVYRHFVCLLNVIGFYVQLSKVQLTVEIERTCLEDELSDIHTRLFRVSDEDNSFEVSHLVGVCGNYLAIMCSSYKAE